MSVYKIDPLSDPRWLEFLESSPSVSVFHTPGWLAALQKSYGFEPVVLTTSPPGVVLTDAVPLCRVNSWISGHRLVSLPFSDHCTPLVKGPDGLTRLLDSLRRSVDKGNWNCIELRLRDSTFRAPTGFSEATTYYLHTLDLRASLGQIFDKFHKDCVQRKIGRAEREGLKYEGGNSDVLLDQFYNLLLRTRRRQGIPPQPAHWFRNLVTCLGDQVKIHVAFKEGRAVASILTLQNRQTLVYKYGCSDQSFHHLGGMQFLLWRVIKEAKANRLEELDLGRSDRDNPGLITFKDRWGSRRSTLTYWRYPAPTFNFPSQTWPRRASRYFFAHMPNGMLTLAGKVLYKHVA